MQRLSARFKFYITLELIGATLLFLISLKSNWNTLAIGGYDYFRLQHIYRDTQFQQPPSNGPSQDSLCHSCTAVAGRHEPTGIFTCHDCNLTETACEALAIANAPRPISAGMKHALRTNFIQDYARDDMFLSLFNCQYYVSWWCYDIVQWMMTHLLSIKPFEVHPLFLVGLGGMVFNCLCFFFVYMPNLWARVQKEVRDTNLREQKALDVAQRTKYGVNVDIDNSSKTE